MSDATRGGDVVLWDGTHAGWTTNASSGSGARLSLESTAASPSLRLDFTLRDATSWAIARRELDVVLPPSWVVTLRIRGQAAPNELQVKLVDVGGENVWWWRRRAAVLSPDGDGAVDLTMRAERGDRVRIVFGGTVRRPPGGVVIASPRARPLREVAVDGRLARAAHPTLLHLDDLPGQVEFFY